MIKNILLFEDEPALSFALSEALAVTGYAVTIMKNGDITLEQLKGYKPDLVILDVLMPGVNGIDVLKLIRSDADMTELPVFVLTNPDSLPIQLEVQKLGVERLWIKSDYGIGEIVQAATDLINAASKAQT
jgi:DNA-binding response OmpR family regulator